MPNDYTPRRLFRTTLLAAASIIALAGAVDAASAATLIDLSAEASRPATNDLLRAMVAAEASGGTPREVAQKVNALIAENLATAKAYSAVKVQSGGTTTYPVYAKSGKIESWRMRSTLALESADPTAFSELLGKLQTTAMVTDLAQAPSPATRKRAEDAAMLDALAAFKERAQVLAEAFGKPYKIKQLTIQAAGVPVPLMRQRAVSAMSAAESMPMPVEAGDSQVRVSVSGQIEVE